MIDLNRIPALARRAWLVLAAAGLMASVHAQGQDYPNRPIKLIVPFAAGSGTDAIARITAQSLGELLGVSVVVDNKAGANGTIAAEAVQHAPPDGYTLFMTTNTTHSANPSLMKKINYDPVKDFTPVGRMGNLPFMLVVGAQLPVKSVAELIAWGKANPGKLSYASGNSTGIVGMATFGRMVGLDLLHIPYKSTPPAMTDVIGGQVSMMLVDTASSLGHVRAGKLRALAVTTEERSALFPDLPPMQATAGLEGYDITSWNGVFAPAGLPKPIVTKLNAALNRIVQDKTNREKFTGLGFDAFGGTPEQLASFVDAQLVKWGRMVKNAGIQPE